jgi:hypothetical protein
MAADVAERRNGKAGQATVEYVLVTGGILLPLTFAIVYTAQLLWVWNSVVDFTREGAKYATTHCWQDGGGNVTAYMRAHVPAMVDMEQFQNGEAEIVVDYFGRDAETGALVEFACEGECSTLCVPDVVRVRVQNYEFRKFMSYMGLPGVRIPDFSTTLPMESAGCDPEQGTCLP